MILTGCQSAKAPTLFTLEENTGIAFTNKVENSAEFNIFSYRNFYNGGGCAIGDINNDGLADVYFTANQGSNKLFLNKGGFQFEDITLKSGTADSANWSTGVVMVDINYDGWLDIYVCNAGYINGQAPQSRLFINNHSLGFTDSAEAYGLQNKGGYATHAAFFDYDKDEDLDCFIINNSFIPTNTLNYENKRGLRAADWPVAEFLKGGGDRFLRNDNGKFVDISREAGIYGSLISFGLGVTVGDINNDGWDDVYVSNDFFERDYVYINQQNGSFKDEYDRYIRHSSHSSMGADMCDVNNDGFPDIFTTEMLPDDDYRLKTTSSFESIDVNRQKIRSGFAHQYMQNTLQMNNGEGSFNETAFASGVAASDWSWGGLIFDADNNSLPDIFVCNGIYKDVTDQDFIEFFGNEIHQKMAMSGQKTEYETIVNRMPSNPIPNKMYLNNNGKTFSEKAKESGLGTPSFSNGAAYGDLDNDGDLDLVVNNVNMPCFVYRNNSAEQKKTHSITLQLKDSSKNSFAIGSKITAYCGKEKFTRELIPTRGFQSSVDYKTVLGLGAYTKVDSLHIIWPDQKLLRVINPAIDTIHLISKAANLPLYVPNNLVFKAYADTVATDFLAHREDDYIDFYNERNIPFMQSRMGPAVAIADINGDGLDDIFIGGAAQQTGQIYLQTKLGGFVRNPQPALEADLAMEDVCAVWFDADKDGDKDLLVGSGGNHQPAGSTLYQTRLYLNDGKGMLTKPAFPLSSAGANTGCITVLDFDEDGDEDIFVGNRSVPGFFGETPGSLLLVNDGRAKFNEANRDLYQSLAKLGNVTCAIWTDILKQGKKNLLVVGEWMAPRIFSFNGKKFEEINTNLTDYKGLWQTALVADLDNDGDSDMVLGNMGTNCLLQADPKNPVKLWLKDFDANGTVEKVLTRSIDKRDMPMFIKKEMTEQVPSLKKQNLKNEEYARKDIHDLFGKKNTSKAIVKEVNKLNSLVVYNQGNGQFMVKELPWEAQLSCVNAICTADVNGDGKKDLLIGSNKFDFLPQFGRLDAASGITLINKTDTSYEYLNCRQSGFFLEGCVRYIVPITVTGQLSYLWIRNDDKPILYKLRK